jgi:hypothetical protein
VGGGGRNAPWVGNGGKVGEQVWGFGLLELARVAVGEGGWDGG